LSINIEELSGQILPVLKRFGVKKAAIFGSLARGEGGKESDVDILVEYEPGKSLLDLAGAAKLNIGDYSEVEI